MSVPQPIIASPAPPEAAPCAPCPECGHCCATRLTVDTTAETGSFWGFLAGTVTTCVLGGMVWLARLTG